MLKGVNRQVIEVHDLDHEYFEGAILFLKPEPPKGSGKRPFPDRAAIWSRAQEYLSGINYIPRREKRRRRMMIAAMKLGGAAAVGATVATLLFRV